MRDLLKITFFCFGLFVFLQVQDLVERCILLYMTPKEIVSTLQEKAKIEPMFTKIGNFVLLNIHFDP